MHLELCDVSQEPSSPPQSQQGAEPSVFALTSYMTLKPGVYSLRRTSRAVGGRLFDCLSGIL